jgi:hypothetical protein
MCVAKTLHKLAEAIGGKAWGVDIGMPRVYFGSRLLHAKVFIAFPKAVGASLGCPVLRIHHQRPGRPYPLHKRIQADDYKAVLVAAQQWLQKNSV